ncbi:ATP-binding protein [Saccharothrix sp. ST-888]|uniref:ATP-binding protein n=1 Tax=Saccharothrix sp. ST-888 TaxID=1427391 RepID=UPI000B2AE970
MENEPRTPDRPTPHGPPARQLPAELTSFIGRDTELAAVERLLELARLVTVTGPGGVGKSRLALRAATLAEAAGGFADGIRLVEVSGVQAPELLGHAVLEALRLTDSTARPPVDVLTEQLADRELLLVLDGCEHLVAACAELVDALLRAAPRLRVLATSRESLRSPAEHLLPVTPLPVTAVPGGTADAVRLFADRAAAVLPEFVLDEHNAEEIALLCHRLDGIPLAVELAAGRLRALSVEQIVLRLDDRFRLLTGGARGALLRHQTLRTTIGWSHQLCRNVYSGLASRSSPVVSSSKRPSTSAPATPSRPTRSSTCWTSWSPSPSCCGWRPRPARRPAGSPDRGGAPAASGSGCSTRSASTAASGSAPPGTNRGCAAATGTGTWAWPPGARPSGSAPGRPRPPSGPAWRTPTSARRWSSA